MFDALFVLPIALQCIFLLCSIEIKGVSFGYTVVSSL